MKLNYIENQIVSISRAANIYSQHAHSMTKLPLSATCIGILVLKDFIGV